LVESGATSSRAVKLDELDRRIISLLQRDGRRSYADIARSIGVGKQTVNTRVSRLLRSGAILITARVDPVAMGFPIFCSVGVRVRPGAVQTVGALLAAMQHVAYVAYSTGIFDLLVDAFLPDTEAVFEFLNQKLSQMDGIVDTRAWLVLRSAKYIYMWEDASDGMDPRTDGTDAQDGGLEAGAPRTRSRARASEPTTRGWTTKPGSEIRLVRLDNLDRGIIHLLRQDGRRPYADIARLVHVTEATVAKRVDRLLGAGALLIIAHVNWPVVGLPFHVSISIKARRGRVLEVGSRLAAMANVAYVGYTTGDFDVSAEVFLRDSGSLLEFLNVDIAAVPWVESTETWHVLHTEKLNYMWEGETIGRTPLA
jgi:Lrp/AsnC family transcriptional regulator, regulator for asnA, asnC and gidA